MPSAPSFQTNQLSGAAGVEQGLPGSLKIVISDKSHRHIGMARGDTATYTHFVAVETMLIILSFSIYEIFMSLRQKARNILR